MEDQEPDNPTTIISRNLNHYFNEKIVVDRFIAPQAFVDLEGRRIACLLEEDKFRFFETFWVTEGKAVAMSSSLKTMVGALGKVPILKPYQIRGHFALPPRLEVCFELPDNAITMKDFIDSGLTNRESALANILISGMTQLRDLPETGVILRGVTEERVYVSETADTIFNCIDCRRQSEKERSSSLCPMLPRTKFKKSNLNPSQHVANYRFKFAHPEPEWNAANKNVFSGDREPIVKFCFLCVKLIFEDTLEFVQAMNRVLQSGSGLTFRAELAPILAKLDAHSFKHKYMWAIIQFMDMDVKHQVLKNLSATQTPDMWLETNDFFKTSENEFRRVSIPRFFAMISAYASDNRDREAALVLWNQSKGLPGGLWRHSELFIASIVTGKLARVLTTNKVEHDAVAVGNAMTQIQRLFARNGSLAWFRGLLLDFWQLNRRDSLISWAETRNMLDYVPFFSRFGVLADLHFHPDMITFFERNLANTDAIVAGFTSASLQDELRVVSAVWKSRTGL